MVIRVQDKKREAQNRVAPCCSTAKPSTFLPTDDKKSSQIGTIPPISLLKTIGTPLA